MSILRFHDVEIILCHSGDNCPTCGQLFSEEGRPDRERELNAQIKALEKEKTAVLALSEKLKSASDIALRMRTLTEQIDLSSVCMYVCMYVFNIDDIQLLLVYVCMYVVMYVCIHTYVIVSMYVCIYVCMYEVDSAV